MSGSFYGLFFFAVLVAVIAAVLCKQAIVFARALVFALLLPMLVGVLFIVPSVLGDLLTAESPETVSFDFSMIFLFALMGGISGYMPAMLTIAVSDCLWVLWRVRYWFVPIILGALFSALYLSFVLNKGIEAEAILIFAAMGATGGLLFILLRQRWMPLAKQSVEESAEESV